MLYNTGSSWKRFMKKCTIRVHRRDEWYPIDVAKSFWRKHDVIIALIVGWDAAG